MTPFDEGAGPFPAAGPLSVAVDPRTTLVFRAEVLIPFCVLVDYNASAIFAVDADF